MRVRLGLIFGLIYLGIQLLGPKPDIGINIPGLLLIFLGEGLRIRSSGFIVKNKTLTASGPYAHLRHPLYTGSFLLGLGFILLLYAHDNPFVCLFLLVPYLIIFPYVYLHTVKKEEENMKQIFNEEFIEYQKNVPLFFPRLKPYKKKGRFHWQQVIKNHEYNAFFGTIGLLSLYFFRLYS
ncbi:MAG: isoprenylcysteine carboxylmethyltransferase family protein [Thermodesulfobacteriota bacterium]|nr:isoprenylcysteine carboxylmethyltransferase family protein [Thermodesulfobacteriota bacterium]